MCIRDSGTTDFIFGPSTALFEDCIIHSKRNSYVTAASTPKEAKYGYVFKHCKLTAEPGVDKVYLGRPWRPYAYTCLLYTSSIACIRAAYGFLPVLLMIIVGNLPP